MLEGKTTNLEVCVVKVQTAGPKRAVLTVPSLDSTPDLTAVSTSPTNLVSPQCSGQAPEKRCSADPLCMPQKGEAACKTTPSQSLPSRTTCPGPKVILSFVLLRPLCPTLPSITLLLCGAPQSALPVARGDAAQFTNCLKKSTTSLILLGQILFFNSVQ